MRGGESGVMAVGRAMATRGAELLNALPELPLPPLPTLQSLQQQPAHADDPKLPSKCAVIGESNSKLGVTDGALSRRLGVAEPSAGRG